MARLARPSSSQSSQSSLSQQPSDEEEQVQETEMRTRAKSRRVVQMEEEEDEDEMEDEEEDEEIADEDGSIDDEEEEDEIQLNGVADGSASEEDEVIAPSVGKAKAKSQPHPVIEEEDGEEEEEENDELEDDTSEAGELEQGDGDDYKGKGKRSRARKPVLSTRKTPRRSAARKRKAITELSRSGSEESEEDEIQTTPASKGTRKITIRLSPSKNGKGGQGAKANALKDKKPKRVGRPKRVQEEEEDELEEDEEEIDEMAERSDSFDEFENDQSFLSLPKTARQLAKERENQGIDSTSELQELPMAEESKRSKLTESEIALRKSEMARRRRNQTEKKLEDDKIETINRLLKKQVSRRSNRDKTAVEESEAEAEDEETNGTTEKKVVDPKQFRMDLKQFPAPFFRYIQTTKGSSLSLPVEEENGAYQRVWQQRLFPTIQQQTTM